MKLFKCQHCGQMLYFQNRQCQNCGRRLGYDADSAALWSLDMLEDGFWRAAPPAPTGLRFCANAAYDACNWLLPPDSATPYCAACAHNRTVPDLSDAGREAKWRKLEAAKHHLFYTLLRLDLPMATRAQDSREGLAFDFLDEPPGSPARILTGHEDGLITMNLDEADDAARERLRLEMGEPYRTLVGHFRHESGHYFWDRLVRDDAVVLNAFRAMFGDERAEYDAALETYYARGPAAQWPEHFVSAYASAHPWEDFAETWAHYLHIVDTLEMGSAFGLHIHPGIEQSASHNVDLDFDPHRQVGIQRLVAAWLPLAFAVNSINRCMGQPDLYPFVLSPAIVAKLGFVDELVHTQRGRARAEHPAEQDALAA